MQQYISLRGTAQWLDIYIACRAVRSQAGARRPPWPPHAAGRVPRAALPRPGTAS